MIFCFKKMFLIGCNQLKLKKLFTETFAFRKKHIKILEFIGMKKEAVLKKQYLKSNIFIDTILHVKIK